MCIRDRYIIDSRLTKAGGNNHQIASDIKDPGLIYYSEEWEYRERLQSYLKCEAFKGLIGAMKVLGDIQYATVISSNRVEDIRNDL